VTTVLIEEKKPRRSKAEISAIKAALYEEAEKSQHAHTVRHLFYRMVARGLVAKTEIEYKQTVMRLVGEMRENDELPWSWIADGTRWMRKPQSSSSPQQALERCAQTYRRDAMANCPDYVELWCEKNALAGVLSSVTGPWDVPLMISVGFSSKGFLHQTAMTIEQEFEAGRDTYIYQVGDIDPSGERIWQSMQASICRYLNCEAIAEYVHFERLALTPEQVVEYNLPTRPTKTEGNTHAKNYQGLSVEADALDTDVLVGIVQSAIERHLSPRQLAGIREAEKSEREILQKLGPALDNLLVGHGLQDGGQA
jgi:hypothetical protein